MEVKAALGLAWRWFCSRRDGAWWVGLGLSSKVPARDPDGHWLSVEQSAFSKRARRCKGEARAAVDVDKPAHPTL